ncbi:hypothetical protein ACJW31_01G288500 [Castanea mollissima]
MNYPRRRSFIIVGVTLLTQKKQGEIYKIGQRNNCSTTCNNNHRKDMNPYCVADHVATQMHVGLMHLNHHLYLSCPVLSLSNGCGSLSSPRSFSAELLLPSFWPFSDVVGEDKTL